MYSRVLTNGRDTDDAQHMLRRWHHELRWDDALLTMVLFLIGWMDLLVGITTVADSDFAIAQISNINISAGVDANLRDAVRLQGAAGFESGIALVMIAIYRTSRWWRGLRFGGFNFCFIFAVGALGRSVALTTLGLPEPPLSPGYIMLLVRVVVLWVSFALSLYTYAGSFEYA